MPLAGACVDRADGVAPVWSSPSDDFGGIVALHALSPNATTIARKIREWLSGRRTVNLEVCTVDVCRFITRKICDRTGNIVGHAERAEGHCPLE